MKKSDTYKEIKEIQFPGMLARVYIPDLSPEERSRRLEQIHHSAANLLKAARQH